MSLSLRPRAGSLLFFVAVALTFFEYSGVAQNRAPKFASATAASPIYEFGYTTLTCDLRDPDRFDRVALSVNWGDGQVQSFSYRTNRKVVTLYHTYLDKALTNKPTDNYRIRLTLTDGKGGIASTNIVVSVTNIVDVSINANTPITQSSPALRALDYAEFRTPSPNSYPHGIALGPDGNIWFTEVSANKIGRLTPSGAITEFSVAGAQGLAGICAGPDGRLWFTCYASDKIGRITTNGGIQLFNIPHPSGPLRLPVMITPGPDQNSILFAGWGYRVGQMNLNGTMRREFEYPAGWNFHGVATSSDGHIWASSWSTDYIVRTNPATRFGTNYPLPFLANPRGITRGPDDAMWFTQWQTGMIGRITLDGDVWQANTGDNLPYAITTGPDGDLWFTEQRSTNCNIVRCRPSGVIQRFGLAWLSEPSDIASGPDDSVYFTLSGRSRIGRLRYNAAGNVVLFMNVYDPSRTDRHTLTIDWGDSSPAETVRLKNGVRTHSAAHTYVGSGPSYQITVTVQDDDNTIITKTQTIDVVSPLVTGNNAQASSQRLIFERVTQ